MAKAPAAATVDPDLGDEDTAHMDKQMAALTEEVDGLDYKILEMKQELTDKVSYADERIKVLQERIAFHRTMKNTAITNLGKLGVKVAATTTTEEEEEFDDGLGAIENGNGKPKKKKAAGRKPTGDNKYTMKDAVALVLKGTDGSMTLEELAQKIQMPEETGGAGWKTDQDIAALKTSVNNSGLKALIASGVAVADPTAGKEKKYMHTDALDKMLAAG